MRCSTVAAAAAVFFGVALAAPQKVVTQTEIVTITSCAPDVPDCPGRTSTSTYVVIEPTAETTTPCGEVTSISTPVIFPNTTAIVCPGHPDCPVETSVPVCPGNPDCPVETSVPVCPGNPDCPVETTAPVCPGHPDCPTITYVPTGTGSPSAPANTSSPVVPTAPPQHTGAAVRTGASLVAVLGAAALALLA